MNYLMMPSQNITLDKLVVIVPFQIIMKKYEWVNKKKYSMKLLSSWKYGHNELSWKNGELGKVILDEYMKGFQERNPNLYVFSAHLHMDE